VWAPIAEDLWAQLAAALAPPAARAAAERAAELGGDACLRALIRGAPPVYWALSNIRGLALARPAPAALAPSPAAPLPGEPLEYGSVSY
jgi:hypothetical protein